MSTLKSATQLFTILMGLAFFASTGVPREFLDYVFHCLGGVMVLLGLDWRYKPNPTAEERK